MWRRWRTPQTPFPRVTISFRAASTASRCGLIMRRIRLGCAASTARVPEAYVGHCHVDFTGTGVTIDATTSPPTINIPGVTGGNADLRVEDDGGLYDETGIDHLICSGGGIQCTGTGDTATINVAAGGFRVAGVSGQLNHGDLENTDRFVVADLSTANNDNAYVEWQDVLPNANEGTWGCFRGRSHLRVQPRPLRPDGYER